ncbi:MAG: DUF5717 family protein [Lachnospiraceae bacterium]|nr:DUF5717 family protein [Lachnospiraceae bacterium]
MKNIITNILEGDFRSDGLSLDFSCDGIDLELYAGQDYEGSFRIYGHNTEGYVYTDNLNMELYNHEFVGTESEIAFCFHTNKSLPDDLHDGEFIIVSNCGEYIIPYHITIIPRKLKSSLGIIKNLFHFANLAKTNWSEALTLFYKSAFTDLLSGSDRQYLSLYRGLSANLKSEQCLEEFLRAIKKKQLITYQASEAEIKITASDEPQEYLISVTRNGWGFSNLYVKMEGEFLVCDKEVIREEDYLASVYRLPYYINAKNLHYGNNFGRIQLYNADTNINIPITVTRADLSQKRNKRNYNDYKKNIHALMNHYIAFRTKQINQSVWRKETAEVIDRMITADDKDLLPKLFRIQLLITENRLNEAGRMLNRADTLLQGKEQDNPELWCYFIYLSTLENRDPTFVGTIAGEVEYYYRRMRGNWRIGWLLCYLKEEYVANPVKKWAFLRELVNYGNHSPVIFVEAWQILNQNPDFLTRLDNFENHLLLFSAKRKIITKKMIPQIVYLIGRSKVFSLFSYQILVACYETAPSDEVLKVICELLIKGEKTGIEYHVWYHNAIERDLKVTRLYEYFIFSLDQEKEDIIPKQVLLYFSYHNEIDYRYQTYIYAYIHKNRENYPDLSENFQGKIEQFIVNQFKRSRTGKWLCYLYKNYIKQEMINADNAAGLADILFTVKITIHKENIKGILILYDKSYSEITYRVSGKVSHILIYGEDYRLFLIDADGNRYTDPNYYHLEQWLNPDKIGRMIAPLVTDRIGFDIWLCGQGSDVAAVTKSNVKSYQRVHTIGRLRSPYREKICLNLIRYYFDHDETDLLDELLNEVKIRDIDRHYHEEILKIMLARLFYDKAYVWLCGMSSPILDTKLIFRVLRYLITEDVHLHDRTVLSLAYRSFKAAKYEEKTLILLLRYYQSDTHRLRDIWRAARNYGIDTYKLSERLLLQILYTGAFIGEQTEIFLDYIAGGGKSDIIKAFLSQYAYDYFVKEKIADAAVITQIRRFIERSEPLSLILKLAYIKFYAENKEGIDESTGRHLHHLLYDLLEQNIVFYFYKEFVGILPLMNQFIDKVIIEYRAEPGSQAAIYYLKDLEQELSEEGEGIAGDYVCDTLMAENPQDKPDYIREPMTEMYNGIFVKQFLLFYGEILSYYIGENLDGFEYYTESGRLYATDTSVVLPNCRFNQLNDIEIARSVKDFETVNTLLSEYRKIDFLTAELFNIRGSE